MSHPIIADNKPIKLSLEKNKDYYFCSCGQSRSQPFCDGSHAGSSFQPLSFSVEQDGETWLCACKHSSNLPFCDGSHKQFTTEQIATEGPGIRQNDQTAAIATATPEEPNVAYIHQLAKNGLKDGHHGPMAAMGVPRNQLPSWDDIQIMVAQLHRKPLMDDSKVATDLVIGPECKKPLHLKIPLFVSDMSYGSLSEEAKIALATGAERSGTGICSGEGGMLPEEQQANSRYFYELASAKFGFKEELLSKIQAFHFKSGQGAKTGTGGHLPGSKNIGKIAQVRGIEAGLHAISPPTFADLTSPKDYSAFADRVRELSGGVPIGFKMSANHIERDINFALQAGADYIILDGRGGGTGAAPLLFRDNISVPTIPALARARFYLDKHNNKSKVSLIITGGLRTPADFIKALALGADGIALSNSAMQAIGCVAARICNSNNCPVGIATQKESLRSRLNVEQAATQLSRFLDSAVELMQVMARACGHNHLNQFNQDDLASWDKTMSELTGIAYSGFDPNR